MVSVCFVLCVGFIELNDNELADFNKNHESL